MRFLVQKRQLLLAADRYVPYHEKIMNRKNLSVFILLLFSINSFGQERFDSLEVQLQRRWVSNLDSIQVLITTTYGDSRWDWKAVAIYLDKKGEWHGRLTTTFSERNWTETSTNYELIPKSDWKRSGKYIKKHVELSISGRETLKGYRQSRCCGCTAYSVMYRTKEIEKKFGLSKKFKYWLLNKSVRHGYKIMRIEKKFERRTLKYGT